MSKERHLKRIAKILWDKYEDEIRENEDWFWATRNWEINFTYEPDSESVVAYKRTNGITDWSDSVVLENRKKIWKELDHA
jgi:hypothetical protein